MKKIYPVRIVCFILGFCLCLYPFLSGILQSRQQSGIVQELEDEVKKTDEATLNTLLENARTYNSMLYQMQGGSVGEVESSTYFDYESQLSLNGSDIMARLEIPKISVDLPIYHGTTDEVLEVGAGHLEGSSLPVGGENTHSVITGHRGLPSSKLFTRLDELTEGDLFFIDVLGQKLAYRVRQIEVLTPEEAAEIQIEEGRDLVSLITCTPYGINTHRLVITGERVDYEEKEYVSITKSIQSLRELFFAALPFFLLGCGLIKLAYYGIRKKENRNLENFISAIDEQNRREEKNMYAGHFRVIETDEKGFPDPSGDGKSEGDS